MNWNLTVAIGSMIAVLLSGSAGIAQTTSAGPTNANSQGSMPKINPPVATDWEALNQAVKPFGTQLNRAKVLFDAGNLNAAKAVCMDAIAASAAVPGLPVQEQFETLLANVFFAEGKLQQALELFLRHPDGGGGGSSNVAHITIVYCRLRNYREAVKWYREVERSERWAFSNDLTGKQAIPQDWPNIRSLAGIEATAHIVLGMHRTSDPNDRGLRDFLAASKLAPNSALAAYQVGRALQAKLMYSDAARYFKRAACIGHGFVEDDAKKQDKSVANEMKSIELGTRQHKTVGQTTSQNP